VRNTFGAKGHSLVEIMVVMSCGVLLSLAMIQGYTFAFRLYIQHVMMLEVQNSARMVQWLLSKAIRTSGNFGCNGFRSNTVLRYHPSIESSHIPLNLTERVKGVSSTSLTVSEAMRPRLNEDSDALFVLGLKKIKKISLVPSQQADCFVVQGKTNFKSNRWLALCDCSHMDVARMTQTPKFNSRKGTSLVCVEPFSQGFSAEYKKNGLVGEISAKQFYVAKTQRQENLEPIYALYESDLNGLTHELVEGVEKIELTFSQDKNPPQVFLAKEQVSSWSDIQFVEARVKISSVTQLYGRPLTQWWQFKWAIYGLSN